MTRKSAFGMGVAIFLIVLSAWSPWLTASSAEALAVSSFNKSWATIIDGCGTSCRGCGAVDSRRVPFGVQVTLEYGCGLMPEDTPEYHKRASGFVSAFGTVHGFPAP